MPSDPQDLSGRGLLGGSIAAPAHAAAAPHVTKAAAVPPTVLSEDLRRLVSRADLDYAEPASRSEDGMPVGKAAWVP